MTQIAIKKLPHSSGLPLPRYETAQAAGVDLTAAIENSQVIEPGQSGLIPTGIAIALPDGFEAQIRPRSGLAAKHQVTILNAPGTIDSDYRGEIRIILINHGRKDFLVTRGMRIAQLVVAPVIHAVWQELDELPTSERGEGGFGSTGT